MMMPATKRVVFSIPDLATLSGLLADRVDNAMIDERIARKRFGEDDMTTQAKARRANYFRALKNQLERLNPGDCIAIE